MPFELQQVTEVAFTNSNPRSEFHGEEHVRAIDISMAITGENTLLDLVEKGLREHHYTNRDLKAGQEALPGVVVPLPHLRFAHLPEKVAYAKGEKWRGYRFVIDYGLGEEGGSNVDLTDCALSGLWYELQEGGSVTVGFTVQFNGAELQDDRLYGRLAALPSLGGGHVQLLAPATLMVAKKGWRSGQKEEAAPTDGGAPLLDGDEGDGEEGGPEEGSPEAALAAAVNAELDQRERQQPSGGAKEGDWPFPNTAEKAKRRKAAAV